MELLSSAIRPTPSPSLRYRSFSARPVTCSLPARTSLRKPHRASNAAHCSKIDFIRRVYQGSNSTLSILLMKPRRFFTAVASKGDTELNSGVDNARKVAAVAVTIILAVTNRVLYKLALIPMRHYPFFLAQVTTFGYVAVYFSILYIRYTTGIVSQEMLETPKSLFMAIGLLEALGVACGMSAGAVLPGPAIPILSQTFLVWQLVLSVMILGRRYSLNEILGCLLVTTGVILAVTSGSFDDQLLSGIEFLWPTLMVTSSAFHAGASILKEFVFIDSKKRLQGKSLDIFVVNSFGSGFQALFVFLLLPFLSNLSGIPFTELPHYLKNGAACFLNIGGNMEGCEGAPFLPLLFILTNMAFNISLLNLVKMSSALLTSVSITLAVPLSIFALSLPLPYIPEGTNLNSFFIIGTAILVSGLMLYSLPNSDNQRNRND